MKPPLCLHRSLLQLLLLASLVAAGCSAQKRKMEVLDLVPGGALYPYGRYAQNPDKSLTLISSAAHVGFQFEGKECLVFATTADAGVHGYLQYELDGQYQRRVRISGGTNTPLLIEAPAEGLHTVWLYKATEAHSGPLLIREISGKNIRPLQRPAAPYIEFIGNSISCGAAADPSEVPCGSGAYHDQHNAYMAYGPRLARALGANYVVSGVSGIGIYRTWNRPGPGMPEVYEKLDFQENSTQKWNFGLIVPQVVSIALGTNDFSGGDGIEERLPFDSARFVGNYVDFVKLVKSKYPTARIALLSSPMLQGDSREQLQACLQAVKKEVDALYPADSPIALHFFSPMEARGCTGHPSVEDHALLAEELLPFFRELLPEQDRN